MAITFEDKSEALEYGKRLRSEGWFSIVRREGNKYVVSISGHGKKQETMLRDILEIERPETEAELLTTGTTVTKLPEGAQSFLSGLIPRQLNTRHPYSIQIYRPESGWNAAGAAETIQSAKESMRLECTTLGKPKDEFRYGIVDNETGELIYDVSGKELKDENAKWWSIHKYHRE